MVRLLTVSAALCLAPASGQWVLKSGEVVNKPCPSIIEMSHKARLPQGCVAHQAGVWLSRQAYTELELELARLQAAAMREQVLTQRIADLELQLKVTTVAGVCPPCDHTSSILTSTAITTGVCALWTLYQSR
jgi:hypothetical protein